MLATQSDRRLQRQCSPMSNKHRKNEVLFECPRGSLINNNSALSWPEIRLKIRNAGFSSF